MNQRELIEKIEEIERLIDMKDEESLQMECLNCDIDWIGFEEECPNCKNGNVVIIEKTLYRIESYRKLKTLIQQLKSTFEKMESKPLEISCEILKLKPFDYKGEK